MDTDMDMRCTMWPNGNWINCCIGHDYDYADGGTLKDKIIADFKLGRCVWKKGHPIIGIVMALGLSILGYPWFRWHSTK